jgi:lipoate-protein ligase A
MFLIDNNDINDPRFNLALEEYCLRNLELDNDYLLFYINQPSVIIGRHQNALEEIDHSYAQQKGIHVVRRISGGGAVYHDYGNLNFSFIKKYRKNSLLNVKEIIFPVINALIRLGIPVKVNGKNDIFVEGKKISGNAQFSNTKGIIIHGTLLFDSELTVEEKVLNVRKGYIKSKGLQSIKSPVTNISDYLENPMDIQAFKHFLRHTIDEHCRGLKEFQLSGQDWDNVYALSEKKYNSWDWNFGKAPNFTVWKSGRLNINRVDTRIEIKKGRIHSIKISGNFLDNGGNPAWLENKLKGKRYEANAIRKALEGSDFDSYFGPITLDRFIEHVYEKPS